MARHLLEHGEEKEDRTGIGTISVFGYQARYDLQKGFPLLTTKRVPFRLIVSELLWFLRGDTNIKYLLEQDNNIWNEWAFQNWITSSEYTGPDMTNFGLRSLEDETFEQIYKEEMEKFKHRILTNETFALKYGDLGSIYGKQWRSWSTLDGGVIDQIATVIEMIKNNPDSRRLIVSAWNVGEIKKMSLPPCHLLFQFYVSKGKLSCQLYQRSCDIFLGSGFNIASYSLLTLMIAQICGLGVGEFIHSIGDLHLYKNHVEQIQLQLQREPKALPTVKLIGNRKDIMDFECEDFELVGYDPHPAIKGEVAV